jgi:restriction system protein
MVATRVRPTLSILSRWATGWLSRAANAFRLRDLPSHRRRVRRSRAVLRELRAMRGAAVAARAFCYLRQVDPLVYEETVLSALEDAGAFVLRSRRYSGDGGVDGRCWLPMCSWRPHAVQIKRYDSAIAPTHVAALGQLVAGRRWAGGLFVHCGRTGPQSYAALRDARVTLVSGDTLLRLLIDRQLPLGARRDSVLSASPLRDLRRSTAALPALPGRSRGEVASPQRRPGPR